MTIKKSIALSIIIYLSFTLALSLILSHWRSVTLTPPPDFTRFTQPSERKQAFFRYFEPIVADSNQQLQTRREQLLAIESSWQNDGQLTRRERNRLQVLITQYRVPEDSEFPRQLATLKRRIDTLPPALVMIQAAKESGWGQSRFAREANNYFGQWCYKRGCGLIPTQRSAGAYHEVRRFNSPEEAVAAYMHNLNTHRTYQQLRATRATLRDTGKHPSGYQLAGSLGGYSQRGEAYIQEIRSMIKSNNLEK